MAAEQDGDPANQDALGMLRAMLGADHYTDCVSHMHTRGCPGPQCPHHAAATGCPQEGWEAALAWWVSQQAFVRAAQEGRADVVAALLASPLTSPHVDPNAVDDGGGGGGAGVTPLQHAILQHHTPVVKVLAASERTDVNVAGGTMPAPLVLAAAQGAIGCVRALLANAGVAVNASIAGTPLPFAHLAAGSSALMAAAEYGHAQCVHALCHADGIDVTRTDMFGRTALHKATLMGPAFSQYKSNWRNIQIRDVL